MQMQAPGSNFFLVSGDASKNNDMRAQVSA
jgi:hypothetical protein